MKKVYGQVRAGRVVVLDAKTDAVVDARWFRGDRAQWSVLFSAIAIESDWLVDWFKTDLTSTETAAPLAA